MNQYDIQSVNKHFKKKLNVLIFTIFKKKFKMIRKINNGYKFNVDFDSILNRYISILLKKSILGLRSTYLGFMPKGLFSSLCQF